MLKKKMAMAYSREATNGKRKAVVSSNCENIKDCCTFTGVQDREAFGTCTGNGGNGTRYKYHGPEMRPQRELVER